MFQGGATPPRGTGGCARYHTSHKSQERLVLLAKLPQRPNYHGYYDVGCYHTVMQCTLYWDTENTFTSEQKTLLESVQDYLYAASTLICLQHSGADCDPNCGDYTTTSNCNYQLNRCIH